MNILRKKQTSWIDTFLIFMLVFNTGYCLVQKVELYGRSGDYVCQYDHMTLYCEVDNNSETVDWYQPNDSILAIATTVASNCILTIGARPYISCTCEFTKTPFHVNLTFTNSSIAEGDNGVWTCSQINSMSKNVTLETPQNITADKTSIDLHGNDWESISCTSGCLACNSGSTLSWNLTNVRNISWTESSNADDCDLINYCRKSIRSDIVWDGDSASSGSAQCDLEACGVISSAFININYYPASTTVSPIPGMPDEGSEQGCGAGCIVGIVIAVVVVVTVAVIAFVWLWKKKSGTQGATS